MVVDLYRCGLVSCLTAGFSVLLLFLAFLCLLRILSCLCSLIGLGLCGSLSGRDDLWRFARVWICKIFTSRTTCCISALFDSLFFDLIIYHFGLVCCLGTLFLHSCFSNFAAIYSRVFGGNHNLLLFFTNNFRRVHRNFFILPGSCAIFSFCCIASFSIAIFRTRQRPVFPRCLLRIICLSTTRRSLL